MTRPDLDPDLDRLGDALRASTTIDLAREERAARADRREPCRTPLLRRPRVLAGGTLGLASVGTALVLAFTAGGAAAPPAFAITSHSDGSLAINLDNPGQGLVGTNNQLAKMGTGEHIDFTMAPGPASSPGAVECVASPQGATVAGPAISLTVGPGTSNTETIASGNTGAGTWHVASCQRLDGAETMHWVPGPNGTFRLVTEGSGDAAPAVVRHQSAHRQATVRAASTPRGSARRHSATGTVAFDLDTDGGLVGVNRKLAADGTDEHVEFKMAQGPAAASGIVDCTPADASVSGPAVTVTVGRGDSNTETIPAGNTGAGTWHVASCTRANGTETGSLPVEG